MQARSETEQHPELEKLQLSEFWDSWPVSRWETAPEVDIESERF
jgi:hypothetical protein